MRSIFEFTLQLSQLIPALQIQYIIERLNRVLHEHSRAETIRIINRLHVREIFSHINQVAPCAKAFIVFHQYHLSYMD